MAFTNNWFKFNTKATLASIEASTPKKIIEIGSFEGQSTCHWLDQIPNLEKVIAIDPFTGSPENPAEECINLFERFTANIEATGKADKVEVITGYSNFVLPQLLTRSDVGFSYADLVYVDGSHEGCDVLLDSVLSYELCKVGGLICFDDYRWSRKVCPQGTFPPRPAIDTFLKLYCTESITYSVKGESVVVPCDPKCKLLVKDYQVLVQKLR